MPPFRLFRHEDGSRADDDSVSREMFREQTDAFERARTVQRNLHETDSGADILKAFPCGTPENIAVLKSVIPLPVFAVGGVVRSSKRAFLKTADGVGAGIGIYRPELSPEELYRFAKEFMEE